jgi:hypothetical protein
MDTVFQQAKRLAGKRYYFGKQKDGERIYLSTPSWDCDWYWGFGYLGNSNCHYHLDGYANGRNIHMRDALLADYDLSPKIEKNLWEFCELALSAYTLKEAAEFFHKGGAGCTRNPLQGMMKDVELEKRINEELLPSLFIEMDKLLAGDIEQTSEAVATRQLAAWGVKFEATYLKYGKHFASDTEEREIFTCKFTRAGKQFSVRFGQSIAAGDTPPTVDEVLLCLQKREVGSFREFINEFGYDGDDKNTKTVYSNVCAEYEKVSGFFSEEELEILRNESF